jgi:hypothetical protein
MRTSDARSSRRSTTLLSALRACASICLVRPRLATAFKPFGVLELLVGRSNVGLTMKQENNNDVSWKTIDEGLAALAQGVHD